MASRAIASRIEFARLYRLMVKKYMAVAYRLNISGASHALAERYELRSDLARFVERIRRLECGTSSPSTTASS